MSRDVDVAWAAGFLEGEGCFGWYGGGVIKTGANAGKKKGRGYPLVAVCQANLEPLVKLQSIFPTLTLRETKPTSTGKRVWECRATGLRAVEVMEAVLPHMSEKKAAQINDALRRRDARQREMQFCPKGHRGEFGRRSNGSRYCRACQRDYAAKKRTSLQSR